MVGLCAIGAPALAYGLGEVTVTGLMQAAGMGSVIVQDAPEEFQKGLEYANKRQSGSDSKADSTKP